MRCSWRVNIMNGISVPQASDITTSSHHIVSAMANTPSPQRGRPKVNRPLMIVARPMGIVPKNIETVECPKIRRASSKNITQRAE